MIAGAIIEFFPEAILAHLNDLRISVLYMSSLQGLVTAGCSMEGDRSSEGSSFKWLRNRHHCIYCYAFTGL